MPTIVLVVGFALLGGMAVGLQGPLASTITERLGVLESIFIVHIGGALMVGVPLLLRGGGKLAEWRTLPWYTLLAGGLGLVILAALSFAIPRVGVAATVTMVVTGQLLLAMVLDHFGWLGTDVRPVDAQRLLGVVVVAVGVWLMARS